MVFLLPRNIIKDRRILSKGVAKFLYDVTLEYEGVEKANSLKHLSINDLKCKLDEYVVTDKFREANFCSLRFRQTLESCYDGSKLNGYLLGVSDELMDLFLIDIKKALNRG